MRDLVIAIAGRIPGAHLMSDHRRSSADGAAAKQTAQATPLIVS